MDKPDPRSSRRSTDVGMAGALVLLPSILYVMLWTVNGATEPMFWMLILGPVLCGLGAGALLARSLAEPLGARVIGFFVYSAACGAVSFILTMVGCCMASSTPR